MTGSGAAGVSETCCTSGGGVSAVCASAPACVSGGEVSGGLARGSRVSPLTGLVRSSLDTVNRETAMVVFSFERREVRRRMSFPAATSSLDGESEWLGYVRSEKVLRRLGGQGSAAARSGRWL